MYDPRTDFLALLRNVGGTATFAEMPGLDYIVAAMARAGMFRLWTGQAAPTVNQAVTVWLRPSLPSWVAEGNVFLWNADTVQYEPATPELWDAVLSGGASGSGSGYVFQSVTGAADTIGAATSLLAIERAAPAGTVLTLPNITARRGLELHIADWSTNVVNHAIILNPGAGVTIMRQASWTLFSAADQLAGVTLFPSIDLNGWVIAP